MDVLTQEDAAELYNAAVTACSNAYAPFSHFPVGAAALSVSGRIFTGNNVENASYGLSLCAERVAISNMVSAGEVSLKAIAVHCSKAQAAPCGACRQFIIEFGSDSIVIFKTGDNLVQISISELLPYAFTKADLT